MFFLVVETLYTFVLFLNFGNNSVWIFWNNNTKYMTFYYQTYIQLFVDLTTKGIF